jgi:hypothetical protein
MTACSNVDELAETGDGEFLFAASQADEAVSRATTAFDEGTVYYLYALNDASPAWNTNCLWQTPSEKYVLGTESSSHLITLPDATINKFKGKTLDFYGVTKSETTEDASFITTSTDGTMPTVTVQYSGTSSTGLTDVMWASKSKQTYVNSGTIELPFQHVLSKLDLLVDKSSADYASNAVVVTKVEVCDYASGVLDMAKGTFKEDASITRDQSSGIWRPVFEDASQTVTTTSTALSKSGTAVTPIVFPTRGTNVVADASTHSLGLRVTYTVDGGSEVVRTYWVKDVALDAAGKTITNTDGSVAMKPYQFLPNYEYKIELSFTKEALVVTVLPRYYGWISKPETESNDDVWEIGSPVTFGGVVWMDRNLGATSADPTNSALDWEKSRGWYYEFGRSIPYYLNGSMQDPNHINDTSLTTSNTPYCSGDSKQLNAQPYPYIPSRYTTGGANTSTAPIHGAITTIRTNYPVTSISRSITDGKTDNFLYTNDDLGTNYRDWDTSTGHTYSANYWQNKSQQPCPKGWRLPTREEFLTILPYDEECGDIIFDGWDVGFGKYIHSSYPSCTVTIDGVSKTGRYYTEDRSSSTYGNDGVYVGFMETNATYGTVYAIKKVGSNKAYRIKWSIEEVTKGTTTNTQYCDVGSNQKRKVLVIQRFSASSSDVLSSYSDLSKYDWSHPSEVLQFPISGYLHADANGVALIWAGGECIYWTSNPNTSSNTAYSFRMKVTGGNDFKELFTWGQERRGYGCLIRCVRDDSVVDN